MPTRGGFSTGGAFDRGSLTGNGPTGGFAGRSFGGFTVGGAFDTGGRGRSSFGGGTSGGRGGGGRDDIASLSQRLARARRSSGRGADLSGFRPGANPELGGGFGETRTDNIRANAGRAVDFAFGSFLDAFARGDFDFGLDLFERDTGEQLGIEQEVAIDPNTGFFGIRGNLNLLTPPTNLLGGSGVATAIAALSAFGPATAAQLGLDALGQRNALRSIGQRAAAGLGIPTRVDLGFQPFNEQVRAAQRQQRRGQELGPQAQLAVDFAERRRSERETRQRARTAGAGEPRRTNVTLPSTPFLATPSLAPPRVTPESNSAARFLAGRDPRLGIDVLRTTGEALVAAGAAPPRPTVGSVFRPPRPGPLV